MFTMLESNLGYGAASLYAPAGCCRGAERDFVNQQVPAALSYSQMLRMSMEEISAKDMGCPTHDCVSRSDGGGHHAAAAAAREEEEYNMGSYECVRQRSKGGAGEESTQKEKNLIRPAGRPGGSVKGYGNIRAGPAMEGDLQQEESYYSHVNAWERQEEEGYAESDYDLTCLTLGRGFNTQHTAAPCSRASPDVPPPPPVSRSTNTSGFTRTCKLCGTSKTPLWRSGPMGAKSLCNACGIRSNKAKKLSAASAEVLRDEEGLTNAKDIWGSKLKQVVLSRAVKRKKAEHEARKAKKKKSEGNTDASFQFTKGEKQKGMCIQQQGKLSCLHVNITSSPVKTESSSCVTSPGTPSPCSTLRRSFPPMSCLTQMLPYSCLDTYMCNHFNDCVFPKDEEQAAFLLMALSCGLVLT